MRKLTFGMNLSLDGYIAASGDDLGWSVPSDELFQWWRRHAVLHSPGQLGEPEPGGDPDVSRQRAPDQVRDQALNTRPRCESARSGRRDSNSRHPAWKLCDVICIQDRAETGLER